MASMTRTQIQLDEPTREALRRRAFDEGKSISAVAREILVKALGPRPRKRKGPRYDFASISGIIKDDPANVSENHDAFLFGDVEP